MSFPETEVSIQVREQGGKVAGRRSELEIKMDVLRIIGSGIDRPTQVMYKANLSWIALQSTLKSLLERGFLREEELGNRKRYELTQRGFDILSSFQKVLEAMGKLPPVQSSAF
jgi:predicted transcriptional regulator